MPTCRGLSQQLLQVLAPMLGHRCDPVLIGGRFASTAAATSDHVDGPDQHHHRQTGGQLGAVPAKPLPWV
jgi:hypothetical protein